MDELEELEAAIAGRPSGSVVGSSAALSGGSTTPVPKRRRRGGLLGRIVAGQYSVGSGSNDALQTSGEEPEANHWGIVLKGVSFGQPSFCLTKLHDSMPRLVFYSDQVGVRRCLTYRFFGPCTASFLAQRLPPPAGPIVVGALEFVSIAPSMVRAI